MEKVVQTTYHKAKKNNICVWSYMLKKIRVDR